MTEDILLYGNTAKYYCLIWLDRYMKEKTGTVTILDLGCGTSLNLVKLMQKYPSIHYIGVEPSAADVRIARENLKNFNAEIFQGQAHEVDLSPADIVISFSVLEHIYDRTEYLSVAKHCMKLDGFFLINYDAGHFVVTSGRWWDPRSDVWLNFWSPFLAKFGWRRHFQAFVEEAAFQDLLDKLGFEVVEEAFFNTDIKGLCSLVPNENRKEFMLKWYEFELTLNSVGIVYEDKLAKHLRTRNFILQHHK